MAQWWEHSPPTNVARFQIPASTPYVGWVCCWFSPLLREVFSKTNISKFQFDQESGKRRTTMWMCHLQIVIYLSLCRKLTEWFFWNRVGFSRKLRCRNLFNSKWIRKKQPNSQWILRIFLAYLILAKWWQFLRGQDCKRVWKMTFLVWIRVRIKNQEFPGVPPGLSQIVKMFWLTPLEKLAPSVVFEFVLGLG